MISGIVFLIGLTASLDISHQMDDLWIILGLLEIVPGHFGWTPLKKVLEFTTVDGRNIQTLLSGTTPSPPKFNVIVTWSALAPMDEKKSNP